MKVWLVGIESPSHEDYRALLQTLFPRKNDFIAFAQFSVVLPPPDVKQLRLSAPAMAAEPLTA
jgi:hypothetical protein